MDIFFLDDGQSNGNFSGDDGFGFGFLADDEGSRLGLGLGLGFRADDGHRFGLDSRSRRGGLVAAAHPILVIDALELQDTLDFVEVATVVSAFVSWKESATKIKLVLPT